VSAAPGTIVHRRLWLALGFALVAAVIVSSLVPAGPPMPVPGFDKLEHASAYLVLMVWFAGLNARRAWVWVALGLLALGIAIEFAQGAMSMQRTAEVRDVVANAAGVGLGVALAAGGAAGWPYKVEAWLARR
jgi:VanZ family protein